MCRNPEVGLDRVGRPTVGSHRVRSFPPERPGLFGSHFTGTTRVGVEGPAGVGPTQKTTRFLTDVLLLLEGRQDTERQNGTFMEVPVLPGTVRIELLLNENHGEWVKEKHFCLSQPPHRPVVEYMKSSTSLERLVRLWKGEVWVLGYRVSTHSSTTFPVPRPRTPGSEDEGKERSGPRTPVVWRDPGGQEYRGRGLPGPVGHVHQSPSSVRGATWGTDTGGLKEIPRSGLGLPTPATCTTPVSHSFTPRRRPPSCL